MKFYSEDYALKNVIVCFYQFNTITNLFIEYTKFKFLIFFPRKNKIVF
jgi:hypothetical protein